MSKSASRGISGPALAASLLNLEEAVALKRKKRAQPARRRAPSLNDRRYPQGSAHMAHATARETARRLGEKED